MKLAWFVFPTFASGFLEGNPEFCCFLFLAVNPVVKLVSEAASQFGHRATSSTTNSGYSYN